MKVVLCWAGFSGYLAACWRALHRRADVDLSVITYSARSGVEAAAPFAPNILRGLPCHLLTAQQLTDPSAVPDLVAAEHPDVLVISGWYVPAYVRLAYDRRLSNVRLVLAMDTPLRGTWRQYLARVRLRRYLAKMHRIIVPGERAWQYARFLGVEEGRIRRGLYGIDYERLAPLYRQRLEGRHGWPKRFLFAGRYEVIKGMDVLLEAYRRYRTMVAEPWTLTCCGAGKLTSGIQGAEGAIDLGFTQPDDLLEVLAGHGAFILASRYDPWPLVIAESCAAGLPVICTEACGSAVELVRSYFNGLLVPTGDAEALAHAMRWAHEHHDSLPEMGARSQTLAAAYSAEAWVNRWSELFDEL